MLITTEARPDARGPIKDLTETSHRLATAGEEHAGLAGLAKQNSAQRPDDSQADIANELQKQTEEITGTKGSGSFPELSQPHLVLASPAGIATTTAGDTHITSDCHVGITTGKSLSLAVGANLFASVRHAIRLFVQNAGMRMVAAAGDIDIQALSNGINLLAKLDIVQSANRITISAKEELVINGGGSYERFAADSIELGTSGTFLAHAANHNLLGPKSMNVNLAIAAATFGASFSTAQPPVEVIESNAWVEFKLMTPDGPVPGERYILTDPNGGQHAGNVDSQGAARIVQIPAGRCTVEFPDLGYSVEVGTT